MSVKIPPMKNANDIKELIIMEEQLISFREEINAKDKLSAQDMQERNSINGKLSRVRRKRRVLEAQENELQTRPSPEAQEWLNATDGQEVAQFPCMEQERIENQLMLNSVAKGMMERTITKQGVAHYIIGLINNDRELLLDAYFDRDETLEQ